MQTVKKLSKVNPIFLLKI